MTYRPYKFVVQAIPQEIDADGNVVGEAETQPVVIFGVDRLVKWASEFPDKLATAEHLPADPLANLPS